MFDFFKTKENKPDEVGRLLGVVVEQMKTMPLPAKVCEHEWILWKMTEDAKGPIANLFCGECGKIKKQNLTNG